MRRRDLCASALQSDQQIFLFGLPDDEVGTQNTKLALNKKSTAGDQDRRGACPVRRYDCRDKRKFNSMCLIRYNCA